MDNRIAPVSKILSAETTASLKTSLTKRCNAILMELYRSSPIQHKVLAANIYTSPTSLCNMLRRFRKIEPLLIKTEKIGRSTYYSLTETAALYVEEQLLFSKANMQAAASLSQNTPGSDEALQSLKNFQLAAGSSWSIILDDLLAGKETVRKTLFASYTAFLNNMKQLTVLNKVDSIREVEMILHQSILINRLQTRLAAELADYYALKPLFDLEENDFESAILLIDYIFAKIQPNIFKVVEFPSSLGEIPLTSTAFQKIFLAISDMTNDIFKHKGKKFKMLEDWKHHLLSCNFSLYYIAEKCSTIYRIYQSK